MSEPGKADRPGCRKLVMKWEREVTVVETCVATVECHPDDDPEDAINEMEIAGVLDWKYFDDRIPEYGRAEVIKDEGPCE